MALMSPDNWTDLHEDSSTNEEYEHYDDDYSYYYYDDDEDSGVHWQYILFDVLLGVAGLVDLLLVAVVLSSRKLRRGPSAVFIVSLATFDLFHLVSIRLTAHVMWQHEMHSAGEIFCKFGVFIDAMLGNTTVFLLVALAAERYLAVIHPLSQQQRRASPVAWSAFCVVLTWALATILAVPDIFAHEMEDLVHSKHSQGVWGANMNETSSEEIVTAVANDAATVTEDAQQVVYGRQCNMVGTGWLSWYPQVRPAFGFVAYYVIPMLLISVLYGSIVRTLLTDSPELYCRTGNRNQMRRLQAARSLIALIVVVACCLLPIHVLLLLMDYHIVDQLHVLAYISIYMFAVNSVFNASIVSIVSHQYRRRVLQLLRVQCCRRRPHHDTSDWRPTTTSRRIYYYNSSTPSSFHVQSTRV